MSDVISGVSLYDGVWYEDPELTVMASLHIRQTFKTPDSFLRVLKPFSSSFTEEPVERVWRIHFLSDLEAGKWHWQCAPRGLKMGILEKPLSF